MIKKIRVDELEVGMFIEDLNVPWMDHPFLSNRRRIKSTKDIDILVEHRIQEVLINTELGRDTGKGQPIEQAESEAKERLHRDVLSPPPLPPQEPADDALEHATPTDSTPYEEEVRRARTVYGQAKDLVKDLLGDARMGKSVDGERAARVVDDMVDSIFRNHDALASLSRLKNFDDYTFNHSVNVSVLALTLGRHLGIVKGELKRLGVGAILHDVGKMRVPEAVLNKPGRLTEEEFEVMKTHSLHGAKILLETKEVPDECAAVALNHHERFDGRGYPRGLRGLSIGKFGLISAVADVYDAVTSDRVYHKGMPTHQALQKMYEWAKTDFYPIYVQKFIQCIGIYPIGSVVRLDTGEVGVVCRQNHDQLLRPCVRVVFDADGARLAASVEVDLREQDDRGEKPFARAVAATLEAAAAGVDPEAVLVREAPAQAA
ncbi:MAG: HD-GYP domain-containing protein [Deltaproteobacteria bacterium]|nr:HD-GYP domain-containing protein [Deltaproteobacteria bacterium]